ncbi:MAG: 30S ribosome-binding factor RbfA [Candidatus Aphodosoma sp.]
MENTRQERIARMLQKEFGDIFVLYSRKIQGVIISVSEVRISPDLSIARVYLSIFPTDKAPSIIEAVNRDTKALRFELGKRVRHQLRIVPELSFYNDMSIERLSKIDELLNADPYLHLDQEDETDVNQEK